MLFRCLVCWCSGFLGAGFVLSAASLLAQQTTSPSTGTAITTGPTDLVELLPAFDPNGASAAAATAMPAPPEDGQWTMPTKNYANTRYSGLDEITTANVAQLRTAWTFSTGVERGQEAAPIVVG